MIEDHDFQRRTALRLLRGLGLGSVSEAADGTAALDLLADSPQPDVMICDIDMPGMDGIEFIRQVAGRGLASAVVIASGLDTKVLEAVKLIGEAHGLQVLGALEKPLTARRLAELLASYRRQPVLPAAGAGVSVTTAEVVAAFAEGQITTVFEPTVDLADCRIRGAEAVGQWLHPTKGSDPASDVPSDIGGGGPSSSLRPGTARGRLHCLEPSSGRWPPHGDRGRRGPHRPRRSQAG